MESAVVSVAYRSFCSSLKRLAVAGFLIATSEGGNEFPDGI